MSNNIALQTLKEALILIIIGIIYYLVIMPFKNFISLKYALLLLVGLTICIQYFRIILFERQIPWLKPFYAKATLGVLNIPLFFVVLTNFMHILAQFEDYNYTGIGYVVYDIMPGLGGAEYNWLRSTTFFVGIAGMMLITILNFRLIYSVFKYREGPDFLKRK